MAVGEEAIEHLRLADLGFKFQSSIGVRILLREYVEAGAEVTVNGQTFAGPGVVVRKSILREISSTVIGADGATAFEVDPGKPVEMAPEPAKPEANGPAVAESKANRGASSDFLVTLAASGRPHPEKPMSTPASTAPASTTLNATAATPAPLAPEVIAQIAQETRLQAAASAAYFNKVTELTRGTPSFGPKPSPSNCRCTRSNCRSSAPSAPRSTPASPASGPGGPAPASRRRRWKPRSPSPPASSRNSSRRSTARTSCTRPVPGRCGTRPASPASSRWCCRRPAAATWWVRPAHQRHHPRRVHCRSQPAGGRHRRLEHLDQRHALERRQQGAAQQLPERRPELPQGLRRGPGQGLQAGQRVPPHLGRSLPEGRSRR